MSPSFFSPRRGRRKGAEGHNTAGPQLWPYVQVDQRGNSQLDYGGSRSPM